MNDSQYRTESPEVVIAAPLATQVFETLRGWIVTGKLLPGDRLPIRDLAAMVGTSVMPVRAAVDRLVESGLAVKEPYKGARVRALSVRELEEAYDARILIEGECARRGAEVAGEAVVEQMQAQLEALQAAARVGDALGALQRDEALLGELYRASGNSVMVEMVHGLWDRCRPYRVLWADRGEGDPQAVDQWRFKPELIEAVRAGDGVGAQRVIQESYELAKRAIGERLSASE